MNEFHESSNFHCPTLSNFNYLQLIPKLKSQSTPCPHRHALFNPGSPGHLSRFVPIVICWTFQRVHQGQVILSNIPSSARVHQAFSISAGHLVESTHLGEVSENHGLCNSLVHQHDMGDDIKILNEGDHLSHPPILERDFQLEWLKKD